MARRIAVPGVVALFLILTGCGGSTRNTWTSEQSYSGTGTTDVADRPIVHHTMAGCPGCNREMPVGDYCTKCETVVLAATDRAPVHCDECGRDVAAGKYCSGCDQIMISGGDVKCQCGRTYKAGKRCSTCNLYVGTKARYCDNCRRPATSHGCERCRTRV